VVVTATDTNVRTLKIGKRSSARDRIVVAQGHAQTS
jgi:hypothetical protein